MWHFPVVLVSHANYRENGNIQSNTEAHYVWFICIVRLHIVPIIKQCWHLAMKLSRHGEVIHSTILLRCVWVADQALVNRYEIFSGCGAISCCCSHAIVLNGCCLKSTLVSLVLRPCPSCQILVGLYGLRLEILSPTNSSCRASLWQYNEEMQHWSGVLHM